ncbi:MAG: PASTA domain-containing protein [Solirubrobacterales bacterium]|nr:PASTA domain-containing protein [Solirubrobacterales bacterium]
MTSGHRGHRQRRIAAIGAVAAIAATGTVLVATAGGSSQVAAPATSGPTATISVRDLVQTDDQPGTLGYTDTRNVYNQLGGTVTWVPLAGAVIRQDGVLYRVDGNGVYLFNGAGPMYRPFTSGMSDGSDVGELNRDLHAMGYDSGEAIDLSNVDHFQTATGDAIDRWQKAHGFDQTGELDLGRVVFLPGARRIETVELSVGGPATDSGAGVGAGGSAGGSGGTPASDEHGGAVHTVEVSLVRATSASSTPTTPSTTTSSTTSTTTSAGTAPTAVRVPDVVGDPASVATSALAAAGFIVAQRTVTVTDRSLNAVVLDQSPPGGSTVDHGGTVTILAGRYKAPPQTRTGTTPARSSAGRVHEGAARSLGTSGAGPASWPGVSGDGANGASAAGSASGSAAGASSASALPMPNIALVTTSTDSVVTVQLDASKQTEAVVGERVDVTLPSNAVAQGVITDVGRVAQTSSQPSNGSFSQGDGGNSTSGAGSAPQATIPVTIALRHASRLGPLDQAPVTVAFALTTTRNALSIPVSALLATAGGGYALDLVNSTGTVSRVPVTPGSFAGGFVQISGPGIAAGMQVRDTAGG